MTVALCLEAKFCLNNELEWIILGPVNTNLIMKEDSYETLKVMFLR